MAKPKTDSRDRLIEAAARLFQRQGYQGTGVSQIVEESGAPRGSVYFLFPGGKEELALVAINQSAASIREQLRQAAVNSKTLEEWIRFLISHVARDFEDSHFQNGCPVATVTLDSVPSSPALKQACEQAYDSWLYEVIQILIHFGIEESRASELALFMIGAVEGALILCRAKGSTEPLTITEKLMIEWVC